MFPHKCWWLEAETHHLQFRCEAGIQLRQLPVRARQQHESKHEKQKDDLENDVGADPADQVDEAHDAHADEEECCRQGQ